MDSIAVVYYFSGTGNSLVVARDIGENIQAQLIPIASQQEKKVIDPHADIMGIVFPVYYNGLPLIIRRFAERLDNIGNTYIFAVCTYGGGTGDSLTTLRTIIRSRGGKLSAQYGVHMPQNAFCKPWEDHEEIFTKEKKKIKIISNNTIMRKKELFFSDILSYMLLFPLHIFFKYISKKGLATLSDSSLQMPMEKLIHRADSSFGATDSCTGCGMCSDICPVDNIRIVDSRPAWQHHCENCLACYTWCPHRAIHGEIPQEEYYYHHPEITFSDIAHQKKVSMTGQRKRCNPEYIPSAQEISRT
ncbi:MAG: 4Fe-4S binding protein [Theionarchaea archaeon]|nr:4Fe-4S binding protein [Theionarchaea archaeon]